MEPCGSKEDAERQRPRQDFPTLRGTWQTKGRQPDTYAAVRALCISLLDDALSPSPQTTPSGSFKLNCADVLKLQKSFYFFSFVPPFCFFLFLHYYMFLLLLFFFSGAPCTLKKPRSKFPKVNTVFWMPEVPAKGTFMATGYEKDQSTHTYGSSDATWQSRNLYYYFQRCKESFLCNLEPEIWLSV